MPSFTESAIKRLTGLDPFPLPPIVRTAYPVVFMHGFGLLAGMRRGGHLYPAAAHLRMHGVVAYAPNVAPYNTVSFRAEMWMDRLRHVLTETGSSRVNIIAHSMGGLDARYLISARHMHSEIASLTTISSPHRGTHIAEFILNQPERVREALADLADWLGTRAVVDGEADFRTAIAELTPRHMFEHFNPQVPNHPDVRYRSYGGVAGKGTTIAINPFLRLGNTILYNSEGPNDGIVSLESAKWGVFSGTVRADHASQVGLNFGTGTRFDSNEFYLQIVRDLAADGY